MQHGRQTGTANGPAIRECMGQDSSPEHADYAGQPNLFDGLIAGAPANWWTHLLLSEAYIGEQVRPVNSSRWISTDLWSAVAAEVLRQCDTLDGVADGVLQNPKNCQFRPEAMACLQGATDTSACLNSDQIAAIKKIYSPWTDSQQNLMFPGFNYGTETYHPRGLFGTTPFLYAQGILQLMGLVNATNPYNASAITVDTLKLADQLDPGRFNATSPDLRAYLARGGKIIHYHGLADRLIVRKSRNPFTWVLLITLTVQRTTASTTTIQSFNFLGRTRRTLRWTTSTDSSRFQEWISE